MNGLLLIDKPKGWTSHDVVAKVRGIIKKETGQKKPKVGHAGTLDPLATGLLIILVGDYCKRADEFLKLDKTYDATITLGQTSTTDDEEGDKTEVSERTPTSQEVAKTVKSFVGEIEQMPPQFSAIKTAGKRAYKQARAGQKVELTTRVVTVKEITKLEYKYPYITFSVDVSSGTYVRSLARDIGEKLSVGGYLSDLRRISIGSYKINKSTKIETFDLKLLQ